jgi:TRAP-type transport system periplasmic protein
LFLAVASFLLALLVLGECGCSSEGPQTPATDSLDGSGTGPIDLVFNVTYPRDSVEAAAMTEWADRVTTLGKGQVRFKIFYGSSLFSSAQIIPNVLKGSADLSNYIPYGAGMELNQVFELPFIQWPSPQKGTIIIRQLFARFPELEKEYQGLKVMYITMWGATTTYLNTRTKPVRTRADLQGLKLAMPADPELLDGSGATPVLLSLEDIRGYLKEGVIDGYFGPLYNTDLGSLELTSYHTDVGVQMFNDYNTIVFNPTSWSRLPANVQAILSELEPYYTRLMITGVSRAESEVAREGRREGHVFVDLSADARAIWEENAQEARLAWLRKTEAMGKPARALYDELNRLIDESK